MNTFELFVGKEDVYDCDDFGADGFIDLTLKFDMQEIVNAFGEVGDGEALALSAMAPPYLSELLATEVFQ